MKQLIKEQWRTLILVFILLISSFLIRWWYINGTSLHNPFSGDAREYAVIAHNLANHGAYTTDQGPEVKSSPNGRDPGYPFFLAAIVKATSSFDHFYFTTLWLQSLLGAITVVISFFMARFFMTTAWSTAVGVLTMFSPHLISMTNYFLTETLFALLMNAALLLYFISLKKDRLAYVISSALCFAMAMSVRTVLQLFPIALAALTFYFLRNKRDHAIRSSLVILLVSYVFFIPWKTWSHFTFKDMEKPSSMLINVFYEGSYVGVIYEGIPAGRPRYGIGMVHRDDPEFARVIKEGWGSVFSEIGNKFRANPVSYSSWYLFGKPAMFWRWSMFHAGDINVYSSKYLWYDHNKIMGLTKKAMRALHPVVMILMHLGAVLFLIRRKRYSKIQFQAMVTIFILILYFLSIHTILVPAPRYAVPLRPLVYLLAVFALAELTGMRFSRAPHEDHIEE